MERLLREHNIEVAFPQMDVHIKEMPPRALTPRDLARRSPLSAPAAVAGAKDASPARRRRPLRVRPRVATPATGGLAKPAEETGDA